MTSKASIDDFIAQPMLAVAGASRDQRKFGNMVYRDLKAMGYRVFAVNPNAETVEGDLSYKSLADLPEKVGGVVIVTPPAVTEKLVQEVAAAGICRVWMQRGAESRAAIEFCQEHGITLVHGECIRMYAPGSASFHKFHKFVKELFGGKPT